MATRPVAAVLAALLLAAGCAGDGAPDAGSAAAASVADGWSVEVVREDLDGPTQVVQGPGGALWLAQLAGGEGAGTGEVLRLEDPADDDPEVVLEGLRKPTGLAVTEDAVWVQLQDVVVRAERDGDEVGEAEEVPATQLPNNGRSQGTLTVLADGRLAHEASGTGSGPDPVDGSGVLYALDPSEGVDAQPIAIATGFKGAYAHAPAEDGQLWVTEVGDGSYDGDAPPDELDLLDPMAPEPPSGGWPACVGDQEPVEENGGDATACDATLAPVALFPAQSTPTSVAVTEAGRVLVALWVDGRVVEVGADGEVTDVLTGVDQPQHLLADGDDVLLTVFGSDALWRLVPPS